MPGQHAQLLFGRNQRHGSRQQKLSAVEIAQAALAVEMDAYQACGGVIEHSGERGQVWRLRGQYHRDMGPAVTDDEGTWLWFDHGKRHRADGPAVCQFGNLSWYRNGQLHRDDGPAIEHQDGTREWWYDGQRHRTDGPAIVWADGGQEWYDHGQRHRTDGPAIPGTLSYYLRGQLLEPTEWSRQTGNPLDSNKR